MMVPTPPSADSRSPQSPSRAGQHEGHSDRIIRRNVACISCRDSKVRCKASTIQGQPCQRCTKLQQSCVYDKSHKRITKKSKLDQLEQELKSIKEAVQPPHLAPPQRNTEPPWSSLSPKPSGLAVTGPTSSNSPSHIFNVARSIPAVQQSEPPLPLRRTDAALGMNNGGAVSRMMGERLVSGEDITWYFTKYLQYFHPYMPVLRKRDPDECFEACPMLFWCVVYVASRRYSKDEELFRAIIDHLSQDIWASVGNPTMSLEHIHAFLLVATWTFPTARFLTDPSPMLLNIALTACLTLGLHTGRGSHPHFVIGARLGLESSDQDASGTWVLCCILAQKACTASGIPPPFLQHNDAAARKNAETVLGPELTTLFDLQKFTNRFHTAMAAQISTHGGVHEATVKTWEDELELLKPLVAKIDSDGTRFIVLVAQLEVQCYYYCQPPNTPQSSFPINALRAYNTSCGIISAALALESHSQFLTHGPTWIYRAVLDAAVLIMSTLHSNAVPPGVTPNEADALARQIRSATHRCSIRDVDLPARSSVILDTFWSVRHQAPKSEGPVVACPDRPGATITYGCLSRFRDTLLGAKNSSERAKKGVEAFQKHYSLKTPNQGNGAATTGGNSANEVSANSVQAAQPELVAMPDPWQDIDWNMLLDDEFNWLGTTEGTTYLGGI